METSTSYLPAAVFKLFLLLSGLCFLSLFQPFLYFSLFPNSLTLLTAKFLSPTECKSFLRLERWLGMREGGRAEGERMTEGWRSRDNGWKAGDQWAWSLMEKENQDTPMRRSLKRERERETREAGMAREQSGGDDVTPAEKDTEEKSAGKHREKRESCI